MMNGSGGMFFVGFFMWIFWLLVIIAIVFVIKSLFGDGADKRDDNRGETALEILEKRYARGEIDRDEYQEKKKELTR